MNLFNKLILPLAFIFIVQTAQAISITCNNSGAWNDINTWSPQVIPTAHDDVTIPSPKTVTAYDNIYSACQNLIINGVLNIGAANLTVGGDNLQIDNTLVRNSSCIVNGTLTIAGDYSHQFKIYGYVKFNVGSTFSMTAGAMMIDGCAYTEALSVPAANALLDVTDVTNFTSTGGQIVIFNPHYHPTGLVIKGARNFHNVSFGNNVTLPNFACRHNSDFQIAGSPNKPSFTSIRMAYLPFHDFYTSIPDYQNKLILDNAIVPDGMDINKGVLSTSSLKVGGNVLFNGDGIIEGNLECNSSGYQNISTTDGVTSAIIKGNLIVNGPSTRVLLFLNLDVQIGSVNMIQGKLDLGNKTLSIAASGTGNPSSYVITYNQTSSIGTVIGKNITGARFFPVGTEADYLPVSVTASSGDFSVSAVPLSIGVGSLYNINVQWNINRVSGTSTAQIDAQWNTSNETSNFSSYRQNARLYHHNNTIWEPLSTTVTTLTPNAIFKGTAQNISNFSPFTMLSTAVLPVEWLSFTANAEKDGNRLAWQTASEYNNAAFDIERSADGFLFKKIGSVKAKETAASYDFLDQTHTLPTPSTRGGSSISINYYRLRQIDNNSKESLSKTVSIQNNSIGSKGVLKVYPSITTDYLTVETLDTQDFTITNLLGKTMKQGQMASTIDISSLPIGTYIFKVGKEQVKFVKR
jgi:hypothetical protein